jgi:glycerophosphoryl diester phosphodiesterase
VTRVVAHRGFAGANPENTVGAVRVAATDAAMVEVDVVACADGTPVVFHDARLDGEAGSRGVTDGAGAVADLSPGVVTAAEVLGSGERVPTLDRLLAETDAPLNVELKRPVTDPGRRGPLPPTDRDAARDRWRPLVDRVLDLLEGRDVLYSSFYAGALAAVRARDATAPLAPVCTDLPAGRELADRYGADAIHPSLSAVRAAGSAPTDRTVNVWTVRAWHEADEAVALGADGIVADYPGLTRWLDGENG